MAPTLEPRVVEHVPCLGCGLVCDDITVVVEAGAVVEARAACPLGVRWFQTTSSETVRVGGAPASVEVAIDEVAQLLASARGPVLVYLAPGLSCEAVREVVSLADRLGARLDSVTSDTAAAGFLAVQRRGDAAATLGELRNRADVLVFWGMDFATRYPRFGSRYALEPVGLHVPEGRRGRTVVSVDVGASTGPPDAELRLRVAPEDELAALAVMHMTVLGRALPALSDPLAAAAALAERLVAARYVGLVHDGEPASTVPAIGRADALIALAHALNGRTRAAVSRLRAGGNRSGIDAVLTWQTGYPFAVDFGRGYPRYESEETAARLLAAGDIAAALVAGASEEIPAAVTRGLRAVPTAVIGPGASRAPFPPTVAVDTGVAGIHEGGTAFRMDGVSLPLRPALPGPRRAVDLLMMLAQRVVQAAPRPGLRGPASFSS